MDNLAQEQKLTRDEVVRLIGERRDWKEGVIAAIAAAPLPGGKPDVSDESQRRFVRLLLAQHHFERISNREERIPDAHRATFEWVFKPPRADQLPWADFGQWLEGDSSMYWITGKAGAGKSTLMKFIGHDTRTTQILTKSAGDRRLIIARHYFWNSGEELQMTEEGLLRTLIHDILQQFDDLAIRAFPHEWELFRLFGVFESMPVDYLGLQRRLQNVIKANPSAQFVFFIDGLDEFTGDHSGLATYMKRLSDSMNTKVCVSSRPWNEFEDAFASTPSLRVQDLTYPDVICFIQSNFSESPGYADLKMENEKGAEELLHAIASKASGVFLWVGLVVKLLLTGLTNGEKLSKLRSRLDSLPPDLENLFQSMLNKISDEHREDSSKLFQIVRAAFEPPTVMTLAWADEDDPNFPFTRAVKPLSPSERDARSRRMCRRLNSHCRGLLETNSSTTSEPTVEFLHRTVRDFLFRDEVWSKLRGYTPEFHPHDALCRSYLISMKCVDYGSRLEHGSMLSTLRRWGGSSLCRLLIQFMRYAHMLYEETGDPQLDLYGELARTAREIFGPEGPCVSADRVCWCEGPIDHDDGPFLSLAIALRIVPYVDHRLKSRPIRDAKSSKGQSVLEVAIFSNSLWANDFWSKKCFYEKDTFELVKLLLAHGADPNHSLPDHEDTSAWRELIWQNHLSQPDIYMEFLRHGADPLANLSFISLTDFSWEEVLALQKKMRRAEKRKRYSSHLRGLKFWS